jgi:hypothetical protein
MEESTRSESKTRAREIAADVERHYHNLAYGRPVELDPSFAEAAITYIQTRGKSDRFVTALIKHFGEIPTCSNLIVSKVMSLMAVAATG